MEKVKPDEGRENPLVDEVIRELKRRLYQEEKSCTIQLPRQALILGKLTGNEEKALSASYTPVEFRSKSAPDYDILVSAHLSIEAMGCLALGMPGNEEAACILYSLLQGKKVYILQRGLEYQRYKDRAHKTLYRLLQEYERRIVGFGVRIIDSILDIRQQENSVVAGVNECYPGEYLDLCGRKLLRESDLFGARCRGKGAVLIDRDAIVTPLAMDYITNHSLEVKRR